MSCDPSGASRRIAAWCLAAALVATTGCGADDEAVADGADLDRPSAASMDLVRFEDVAGEADLHFRHGAFQWETGPDPAAMMGGGLCWIDYDRDGWLDLYAVNTWSNGEWGEWRKEGALPTSQLFRNDAGQFVDVTEETSSGLETRGNGCVAADLDLDGWTDLYITTERENVLLWNDGGDGFLDDADASGANVSGWQSGAAVGDIDGNGWPDLFVAGYANLNGPVPGATKGFPNSFIAEPDLLFLNQGPSDASRVQFREAAGELGIEPNGADYGLGAVMSDLDLDGDLDLFVANDTTPNQLYENTLSDDREEFRLVERGVAAGVGDDGAGMGVASGDGSFDDRPDLVVTNQLKERHVVWRNTTHDSGLSFEDARPQMKMPDLGLGATGWGTIWADIDLDTDLDLFFVHGAIPVNDLIADREHPQLLENEASGGSSGFSDASAAVGLEAAGPYLGRGGAAADYDNDGDVDIAIGTIGGDLALLRNTGAGGNWLVVATPAPAPGAVVTVTLADGTELRREIQAGSSYLSSNDPRVHFGLGTSESAVTVTVTWPDGATLTMTDVAVGQIVMAEPDVTD